VNLACFQHPSPEVYDQGLLPLRIILEPDELLTVHLRENEVARTLRSEAILDVNHAGRWIRGIELVGGVDFNLAKAVKPFKPTRPSMGGSSGVTYDEEANATFIYFSMKPPKPESPQTVLKYSHSITPEAEFAFDSAGGLLWLRFSPRDGNKSAADFVSLIDAPIERQLAKNRHFTHNPVPSVIACFRQLCLKDLITGTFQPS
jgi:hypothetical protein